MTSNQSSDPATDAHCLHETDFGFSACCRCLLPGPLNPDWAEAVQALDADNREFLREDRDRSDPEHEKWLRELALGSAIDFVGDIRQAFAFGSAGKTEVLAVLKVVYRALRIVQQAASYSATERNCVPCERERRTAVDP